MTRGMRMAACVLALALAGLVVADEAKDSADRKAQDTTIYNTLREVINRGADLYNSGDYSGCYRLYEGALMTVRPSLVHRSSLQQAITKGMATAEKDPVMWRRAYALRDVLDKVRNDVNPKGDEKKPLEKLGSPKADEKKPEPPEDKKPEDKKPEDKKDEKKPEDKKDEEKKPEEKKPEQKKPDEKKPEEKKDEDKKDD